MTYRVVFHPHADEALVDLWINSQRREEVTRAVDCLEEQLALRPHDLGESREENERVAIEAPIGIEFNVDDQRNEVVVINIWEVKKRGRGANGIS